MISPRNWSGGPGPRRRPPLAATDSLGKDSAIRAGGAAIASICNGVNRVPQAAVDDDETPSITLRENP